MGIIIESVTSPRLVVKAETKDLIKGNIIATALAFIKLCLTFWVTCPLIVKSPIAVNHLKLQIMNQQDY